MEVDPAMMGRVGSIAGVGGGGKGHGTGDGAGEGDGDGAAAAVGNTVGASAVGGVDELGLKEAGP